MTDTTTKPQTEAPDFHCELSALLNRYNMENGSDTPDSILRDFLIEALNSFDRAVRKREAWYGRTQK